MPAMAGCVRSCSPERAPASFRPTTGCRIGSRHLPSSRSTRRNASASSPQWARWRGCSGRLARRSLTNLQPETPGGALRSGGRRCRGARCARGSASIPKFLTRQGSQYPAQVAASTPISANSPSGTRLAERPSALEINSSPAARRRSATARLKLRTRRTRSSSIL